MLYYAGRLIEIVERRWKPVKWSKRKVAWYNWRRRFLFHVVDENAIRSAVRRADDQKELLRFVKKIVDVCDCWLDDATKRKAISRSRGRLEDLSLIKSDDFLPVGCWFVRSLLAASRSVAIVLKSFRRPLPRNGPTIDVALINIATIRNLLSEYIIVRVFRFFLTSWEWQNFANLLNDQCQLTIC